VTADDGTGVCPGGALFGEAVAFQYFVQNTGSVPLVCDVGNGQGLQDTFIVNAGVNLALQTVGPIPVGQTIGPILNDSECNQTLKTNESLGNRATANCTCAATNGTGPSVAVSAFDTAQVNCNNATFTGDKQCIPSATPGVFEARVTVNNTGEVALNCSVIDQYTTANNGVCPATVTCPLAGGTPLTLTPDPINVAVGGSNFESNPNFTPGTTVCNQACITCTPTGGSALPPLGVQDDCPVGGGCFTRTPGYWGTHPTQTQTVLNQGVPGLSVCGINLTNTTAGAAGSAIEDMCGTGGPDFKPNNTSPQQLQLIRQCTAAALNLEASLVGTLNCEAAFPGITADFNNCCGDGGVCDSGKTGKQISDSGCIGILDAFNNQFDASDFPAFLVNSSAQPEQCQIANGNGFVNPGRSLGPK
jgi:hypothetical protein